MTQTSLLPPKLGLLVVRHMTIWSHSKLSLEEVQEQMRAWVGYLSFRWGQTVWHFLPRHRRHLWPAQCRGSRAPPCGRCVQRSSRASRRTSPLKYKCFKWTQPSLLTSLISYLVRLEKVSVRCDTKQVQNHKIYWPPGQFLIRNRGKSLLDHKK